MVYNQTSNIYSLYLAKRFFHTFCMGYISKCLQRQQKASPEDVRLSSQDIYNSYTMYIVHVIMKLIIMLMLCHYISNRVLNKMIIFNVFLLKIEIYILAADGILLNVYFFFKESDTKLFTRIFDKTFME